MSLKVHEKKIMATTKEERTSKQIEQAHQEWISALDAIEYPIFLHDKEFRILRCNQAYQQHAGKPYKEIIGHPYYELFPKNDGPMRHCAEALEYPSDKGSEEEIQIEDRVFFSRGVIIKDDGGNYLYSLHILKDVTQQRQIEQALYESEEKFRALVESTSDWIWEIDERGVYTYVSPRVNVLLGYQPDEVLGKSPFDFMLPKEAERVREVFKSFVEKQEPIVALENTALCKDGSSKILETSGIPFFNDQGEYSGYRGIDRDITKRKRTEEHLIESEKRYRTLFETMLNGFAYCQMVYEQGDPVDFIYLDVNKAFEQQTGLKNVTGKRVSEVIPGIRESDPELFERYARVASGGKPEQFEIYVKSLNMWFFLSLYSPNPECFVAIFDVITERKEAENALKNEVLRRRILMENSRDGIAVVNQDFKVLEVNARFAAMLGYTPNEILNSYVWDFEAALTEQEIRKTFADLSAIDTTIETRHRRKDGSVYDAEVSISGMLINNEPMAFSIIRDITERKQAQEALNRANRALRTLSAGNLALLKAKDEDELLKMVTNVIVEKGGYSMATVRYAKEDSNKSLIPMACAGVEEKTCADYHFSWADTEEGQLPSGRAVRTKTTQICRQISSDTGFASWKEAAASRGFLSNIALPLLGSGKVFGALCIYSSKIERFEEEEVKLLEELASDLSYGIINLRARAEHEQRGLLLRQSLEQSIQTIAATLEARDPYTAGHQRRVAELATAIAQEMKLSEEQVQGIHFAAIIHDLGKIHIPAEILAKPGRLSKIEFMLIQTHPQEGYDILKEVKFPWPIAETILQHHEKLDGTGYPNGLKGDQIRLEARILTVADVVEAISSHRPYRSALGIEPAMNEIKNGRGSAYDPDVVDACIKLFMEKNFTFGR